MEMSEFVRHVKTMREAQKAYFSDRSFENLEKAKECEQFVDGFIAGYEDRQGKLF